MGGGGETQIAAGERRAKGLALRGKVRSSGRFGKTHQQRCTCTSMCTDQCNTTAAIPRKLQLQITGGGKISGEMGEQPGQGEELEMLVVIGR